jgi:imidazoleglycerol phosphate synthase cyclase subunit
MLTRRIIPCLDVRDGRVVKGVRFQNLRDAGDPASLAEAYQDQGADELTLLDVSATPEGRRTAAATVASVRQVLSIPLTVGGGIRSVDDAARLLDAGADKVGINTAAVEQPELITRCAERFGAQCIVVSIDAARAATSGGERVPRWVVRVRSGEQAVGLDAVAWARQAQERGAGEVLLTSWDRDGTRSGYDVDLLRAVADAVSIPVIASGGAAEPRHLLEALRAGADAVLAASIFHDGDFTIEQVKAFLAQGGQEVRR